MKIPYKVLYTLNYARVAGTERHLLHVLENLNKDKFNASVVCFSDGPLIDFLKKRGIDAWAIKRDSFFDLRAAKELYNLLKDKKFDLLHSHCGHFSCIIAKIAKVPYIIETRHGLYFNYDDLDKINFFEYLVNKYKAKMLDLTLTVSKIDQDLLTEKFNVSHNKVKNIQNGIDVSVIGKTSNDMASIKKDLGIHNKDKIVGTVARFTEQKGLKYLIDSIQNVKKEIPNSKFVIVGDGELKNQLISMATRNGNQTDIVFTGYRNDAINLMSTFDVFVLPSLWEGMPYSILEAMALKIPVVATNVFGNKELIVDGKTGILVPPRNGEAIAEAIVVLLTDNKKAKEMGKEGYQRVKNSFSAKKMTEQIEQTYLELINGTR